MLAKTNRFHGRSGITRVYQKGHAIRGQFCTAKYTYNRYDYYRAAVVVSKKVAKSAPARNRIRRRVYELVRLNANGRLANHDIVITVFDERFTSLPHAELQDIIVKLLDQVQQKPNS